MEVGLGPGDFVLDGDPAPPKGGKAPNFRHVYCVQTAQWIKMPLGTEAGLGTDDFVLDGDAAPSKKGACPQFSAHVYCGQAVAHLNCCWALVKLPRDYLYRG